MTGIFSEVLNMSVTGSVVILLVLLVRMALRRAPKIYSYALWAVVLFRLLCPVSVSAPISILNAAPSEVAEVSVPEDTERVSTVRYVSFEPSAQPAAAPTLPLLPQETETASLDWRQIAVWGWIGGMGVMVLYSLTVYGKLRRRLVGAMPWRGNAYLADHIDSPFVLGLLRPKIYLPSSTPVKERRYILAHEKHHIRRGDHIIKLLAYGALCIHWFNPLVWVAFLQAGKDMEMSCDEAVIKKLGEHIRADYSASLLRLATHRTVIAGTPLAFGEGDTKGRVKNMAKWKKPRVWVSILCLVLCVVIAAVCGLNPEKSKSMKELTLMTGENGPCGVATGDLNYTISGGVAHWLEEREDFTDAEMKKILDGEENRSLTVTFFAIGEEVFGGLQDHILPEGADLTNPESWMPYMDLWEWEDPNLGYFGSSSSYGDWELEFFTDVPPGTQVEAVQRKHYFFLSTEGRRVYDMWFDMTVADPAIVEEILSSAYVSGYAGSGHYELEAPKTLRLGSFQLTVPEGEGYIRTGDTGLQFLKRRYWSDHIFYGGVDVYSLPEMAPEEDWIAWVKAVGISIDDSLAVTDETEYGDISVSVDDLKDGKRVKDIMHYFYIHGDAVYDIWFDELKTDEKTMKKYLDSVKLWDFSEGSDAVTDMDVTEELTKQQALERCRAVLEMVQRSEAYEIVTHRINGAGALNPTSDFTELGFGENRLSFNRIPESGGESLFGELLWEGASYACDSRQIWKETENYTYPDPWLVSYQWKDENIAYMDTLTDDEGITVMLRIDEEHPDIEDSAPQYFVNFRFAPDGTFREVTVQGNLFQDNSMLETESIVTLDQAAVLEQIQTEAGRATGKEIQQEASGERYVKTFDSDDGTVTIQIDTRLLEDLMQHGLSLEGLKSAIEAEFRRKNVDDYGLNTTQMGYAGARCVLEITEVEPGGDYLIAADTPVPTVEVWGTRTYVFSNGERMGEEQGDIKLLLLNARDGSVLVSFGIKN